MVHDFSAKRIAAICARFPAARAEDVAAAAADPDLLALYLARTHDLTPTEAVEMLEWLPEAHVPRRAAA